MHSMRTAWALVWVAGLASCTDGATIEISSRRDERNLQATTPSSSDPTAASQDELRRSGSDDPFAAETVRLDGSVGAIHYEGIVSRIRGWKDTEFQVANLALTYAPDGIVGAPAQISVALRMLAKIRPVRGEGMWPHIYDEVQGTECVLSVDSPTAAIKNIVFAIPNDIVDRADHILLAVYDYSGATERFFPMGANLRGPSGPAAIAKRRHRSIQEPSISTTGVPVPRALRDIVMESMSHRTHADQQVAEKFIYLSFRFRELSDEAVSIILTHGELLNIERITERGRYQAKFGDNRSLSLSPSNIYLLTGLVDYLNRRLEQAPSAKLFEMRALALAFAGEYELAVADYDRLLTFDAGNAVALRGRAAVQLAAGRIDEARADFTATLRVLDTDAFARTTRALLAMKSGDYGAAVADLNAAIETEPAAERFYFRALANKARGEHAKAVDDLRKALQLAAALQDPTRLRVSGISSIGLGEFHQFVASVDEAARLVHDANTLEYPDWIGEWIASGISIYQAKMLEVDVRVTLAWILATSPEDSVRSGAEALEIAKAAQDLNRADQPLQHRGGRWDILNAIAAAYAECDDIPHAYGTMKSVRSLAPAEQLDLCDQILAAYRARRPYRDGTAFRPAAD